MSHYRVAVFANSPHEFDELLAPYSENNEEYFEFFPLTGEELDNVYIDFNNRRDTFETFEEYVEDYGYKYDNGQIGHFYNPNAKWDYYSLDGGDWMFEMKHGECYDDEGNARKNQFNYKNKSFNKTELTRKWKKNKKLAEEKEGSDEVKNLHIKFAKYFMDDNPNLEDYLYKNSLEYPYAFITPDGEWHAPGTVGWFATSNDTAESMLAYVKEWEQWINSDENPYVNFVDCHI